MLFRSGDLLVGDDDGVVLLPVRLTAEIALASVEQDRMESFIAHNVRAGSSVNGLYPMNAEWRARYDAFVAGETQSS